MRCRLELELGHADMRTRSQIAAALERNATTLTTGGSAPLMFDAIDTPIAGEPIRDVNGNTVGRWEVADA